MLFTLMKYHSYYQNYRYRRKICVIRITKEPHLFESDLVIFHHFSIPRSQIKLSTHTDLFNNTEIRDGKTMGINILTQYNIDSSVIDLQL